MPRLRGSALLWALTILSCVSQLNADEPRRWPVELESGRFKIHSDFELSSSSVNLAELNRIAEELERLLKIPPQHESIHIVLFGTESEYIRYMRTYFPKIPQRRAIFIQHRGPGMLFTHWHREVAVDLRHEVTHALLNQVQSSLPLWLDEGLAEYFEVTLENRFAGHPYCSSTRALLASGADVRSIGELSSVSALDQFTDAHYRDSWAWTHFLIHRHQKTRKLLIRFLADQRGELASQPQSSFDFERALKLQFADLDLEFREHFQALSARTATFAAD